MVVVVLRGGHPCRTATRCTTTGSLRTSCCTGRGCRPGSTTPGSRCARISTSCCTWCPAGSTPPSLNPTPCWFSTSSDSYSVSCVRFVRCISTAVCCASSVPMLGGCACACWPPAPACSSRAPPSSPPPPPCTSPSSPWAPGSSTSTSSPYSAQHSQHL